MHIPLEQSYEKLCRYGSSEWVPRLLHRATSAHSVCCFCQSNNVKCKSILAQKRDASRTLPFSSARTYNPSRRKQSRLVNGNCISAENSRLRVKRALLLIMLFLERNFSWVCVLHSIQKFLELEIKVDSVGMCLRYAKLIYPLSFTKYELWEYWK